MAIKFQYNKTSLQQLEKQLKMRERSLPTIKSKESALRIEVKRTKDEVTKLELQLEQEIQSYENMVALLFLLKNFIGCDIILYRIFQN